MTKSLVLAATALAFSSAIALAQNAPVSAQPQHKQVVRHMKTAQAKPLYDYAPSRLGSNGTTLIMFGVTY